MVSRTTIHLFCILLLAMVASGAAFGQLTKTGTDDDAEPGAVLAKIRPSTGGSEAIWTRVIRDLSEYGITVRTVRPWIKPELIAYRLPLFKQRSSEESVEWSLRRIFVIEYDGDADPHVVAARMSRFDGVEYAEPVYRRELLYTPNDPRLASQWYLERVQATSAWDYQRGDSTIIVGMVDAGIERTHPDLAAAMWTNPGETGNGRDTNGLDDDGNGFVDDSWGWDFPGVDGVSPDNDPYNRNQDHGTMTAGCVGAVGDNAIGVAGIAYGVRLMAVKITDDSPGSALSHEAEGVLYAAKMGAKVINCSFGGPGRSRAEGEVMSVVQQNYGALVVAACGNNGRDQLYYPASYPGVISVAWTKENDDKSSLSNYSYRVDLSAPGENILSTGTGDYVYDSGTSFSAPLVSGAAALLRLKYPNLDLSTLAELLRASTDDNRGSLQSPYAEKMGAGRLNVGNALSVGMNIQSARVRTYDIIESDSNGLYEPGETIRIRATVRNYLASSPIVTTVAVPVDPVNVVISGTRLELGGMASGEERTSSDSVFSLTIPATAPIGSNIIIRFTTITPDRSNDQFVTIPVAPTWKTTDNNDVSLTFSSNGNMGFNGINRTEGDGMAYRGGLNLLYHSGLMIALDSTRISDVVRLGGTSRGVQDGFRFASRYDLTFTPDSSVETGVAAFDDRHRPLDSLVGVDVRMRTYQYRADDARNFVIVRYQLTNTTNAPLMNLHCALYIDWDVSSSGANDRVDWDAERRMGTMHDPRLPVGTWVGASLLSDATPSFYAVNNFDEGVISDFTPGRKWKTMSSGVVTSDTRDDMAMTIGYSELSIPAGGSVEVGFAILASTSLDSIRIASERARQYYAQSGVALTPPVAPSASLVPNPFAARTNAVINLRAPGVVRVGMYTLDGREVLSIDGGFRNIGTSALDIDFSNVPSGIYVVRVMTPDGAVALPAIHVAE